LSFELLAHAGRTVDYTGSIFQCDGVTPFILLSTDKLRLKVGHGNFGTPNIDLVSTVFAGTIVPTANGSYIEITSLGTPPASPPSTPAVAAKYHFRLAEGDLLLLDPGPNDIEVIHVDSASIIPPNADRQVNFGVLHVLREMAGVLGL
jgi:hypothetical protein